MTAAGAEPAGVAEVLRNPNFSVYFVSAFISNAGTFMQSIGVPIVMYDLTERNAWVGAAVFASMVPSLLMAPIAGTLADRINRKLMLFSSNVVQLLCAAGLWILAAADAITPWRIIGLLIIAGFAGGFQNAVAHALVPLLVPERQLMAALRLNAVNFNIARVIGPAAAGVVLARWGVTATFAINTLTFLAVLGGLLYVRPRAAAVRDISGGWFRDLLQGTAYVRGHRTMRHLIVFSLLVSMLGSSSWQLGAGVVSEVYRVDKERLGTLIAVFGVGALVAGVSALSLGDRVRRSRLMLLALALYGSGAMVSVSMHRFAVGVIGYGAMGVAHSVGAMASMMSLQLQVDDHYRGPCAVAVYHVLVPRHSHRLTSRRSARRFHRTTTHPAALRCGASGLCGGDYCPLRGDVILG